MAPQPVYESCHIIYTRLCPNPLWVLYNLIVVSVILSLVLILLVCTNNHHHAVEKIVETLDYTDDLCIERLDFLSQKPIQNKAWELFGTEIGCIVIPHLLHQS
jgi:hypothetical protein